MPCQDDRPSPVWMVHLHACTRSLRRARVAPGTTIPIHYWGIALGASAAFCIANCGTGRLVNDIHRCTTRETSVAHNQHLSATAIIPIS